MNTIKLIAIDIDGVLLKDTFSPVIYKFMSKYGVKYTREVERNIFSRSQKEGSEYISKLTGLESETVPKYYFEEREQYLKTHDGGIMVGVPEILELLSTLNVRLVYYGGLTEDKINDQFKNYSHYFERYICTNDFRPGIKEITRDIYGLQFQEVLFIDDVNTVAETAKMYNVPFIGIPSDFQYGFQRQDMVTTGVKYLLKSVTEINRELLERIDAEAQFGTIWQNFPAEIP